LYYVEGLWIIIKGEKSRF